MVPSPRMSGDDPHERQDSMSHAIFGERFLGVREGAWHRIGQVIDEPIKPSEAIEVAGLDYGVEKQELFLPNGVASGYSAIIREGTEDAPEPEVFGIAKDYELVHITEIADQLDEFPWPITSVGAIRKGAEIFLAYDLGDRDILGEDYKMYLAVAHPYAPGTAWRAMLTPIRVVCQNTLIVGENLATANFVVKHHPGARSRIDQSLVLAKAAAMENQMVEAMTRLKDISIDQDRLQRILEFVYPTPKPQYVRADGKRSNDPDLEAVQHRHEQLVRRTENLRLGAVETYNKFNDEHREFAGSGYALYQALVEWADWRPGKGEESRMAEASIVGVRADEKKRAYRALTTSRV